MRRFDCFVSYVLSRKFAFTMQCRGFKSKELCRASDQRRKTLRRLINGRRGVRARRTGLDIAARAERHVHFAVNFVIGVAKAHLRADDVIVRGERREDAVLSVAEDLLVERFAD